MSKNFLRLLLLAVVLVLVVSACQAEPEVIVETVVETVEKEVTRFVTETIMEEGEEVEVTRVVTETVVMGIPVGRMFVPLSQNARMGLNAEQNQIYVEVFLIVEHVSVNHSRVTQNPNFGVPLIKSIQEKCLKIHMLNIGSIVHNVNTKSI